jgi:hypothetical protein
MSVDFEVYGEDGVVRTGNGGGSKIDFDGLNKYIVETAQCQEGESLVGVISAIFDLGIHTPKDAEYKFDGSAADEAAEIAKNPATYFKDGKDDKGNAVRLKCYPMKPVQHVTLAVDFPEIVLDQAPFFGEPSNPQPLRMYFGGEFYMGQDIGMVVQDMIALRNYTDDFNGKWSFTPANTMYKLAQATGTIGQGEPFSSREIGKLLGKSAQFSVLIKDRVGKNSKTYLTKRVKVVGKLGRGQQPVDTTAVTGYVGFMKDNDQALLDVIPRHIVNTMKRASNFEGSKLQAQLGVEKPAEQEPKPVAQPSALAEADLDDFPF